MQLRRLVLALAWGALPAAAVALVTLTLAAPHVSTAVLLVVLAPLVEEPLKALGAWLGGPRTLREGAAAGAVAGLGFGLVELLFRSLLSPAGAFALLAPAMHVAATACAGAAIGAARGGRARWAWLGAAALALHAAFNAASLAFA